MITLPSYFIGKINLPQTGNTSGQETVQQFIDDYEPEYLQKALGYDLWKAFAGGIEAEPYDQRWQDLLDGKEFVIDGATFKWPGFAHPQSPIAKYVYYQFMDDAMTSTSLVGEVVSSVQNNTLTSPVPKMVDAWNKMVYQTHLLAGFLNANKDIYPEWHNQGSQWSEWFRNDMDAYGYWWCEGKDEVYRFKNQFGL